MPASHDFAPAWGDMPGGVVCFAPWGRIPCVVGSYANRVGYDDFAAVPPRSRGRAALGRFQTVPDVVRGCLILICYIRIACLTVAELELRTCSAECRCVRGEISPHLSRHLVGRRDYAYPPEVEPVGIEACVYGDVSSAFLDRVQAAGSHELVESSVVQS